ncbi:hypothetical protein [Flexibacterium corallicola]|uniref:hypothetical protein n=1 Tax=Flexibacterium corallicola TaxID=3037259 RepID=UPI00286F08AB|nr:hypothetical protein [Pseudovibrio sp. M1P-2-3]
MIIDLNPHIDDFKAQAFADIDQQAEERRCEYVTTGSAQAMVYLTKDAEALAYQANTAIDPALIPHIAAEASATSSTLADIAALVIQNAESWRIISARIEGARRGAKTTIEQATTLTQIKQALVIDWATIEAGA